MRPALFAVLLAACAHTAGPFAQFNQDQTSPDKAAEDEAKDFAWLNGVGGTGHKVEVTADIAAGGLPHDGTTYFATLLDGALAVGLPGSRIDVVLRLGAALDGQPNANAWEVQGAMASLGARHISQRGNFMIESGLRVLPGFGVVNVSQPGTQALALGASLTSATADDTRWLPLAKTGAQFYLEFLSRQQAMTTRNGTSMAFGAHLGGQASISPITVHTWLGDEQQFLGNVYLEGFFAVAKSATRRVGFVIGLHADVSLSSIWPQNEALPFVANLFVGWSPFDWLSLRAFGGAALSALNLPGTEIQGGLRVQFYFL